MEDWGFQSCMRRIEQLRADLNEALDLLDALLPYISNKRYRQARAVLAKHRPPQASAVGDDLACGPHPGIVP
jgi:hypothetical protein